MPRRIIPLLLQALGLVPMAAIVGVMIARMPQ